MELLRAEHSEQINSMKEEINRLQRQLQKIKQELIAIQKNSKHHTCELNSDNNQSFLIQNIDIIKCTYQDNNNNNQQKQQYSKLDESQLYQFNQIVTGDDNKEQNNKLSSQIVEYNNDNNVNSHINNCVLLIPKSQQSIQQDQQSIIHQNQSSQLLKKEEEEQLKKQLQNQNNKNTNITKLLQQQIHQLNIRILELQSQVQSLFQTNQQLKKSFTKLQLSQKSTKNNYQSLYKQSKFMADHIRTLANDKFKLQRKVKQLQKQIRDNNLKGIKKSTTLFDDKKNITVNSSVRLSKDNSANYQKNINYNKNNRFDLFASQGFDFVKTSQQNSIDSKDLQQKQQQKHQITISKVVSIQNFNQPKQIEIPINPLTQSQYLQVNRQFDTRKSMPSYKKVSHISPSPSFKKPTLKNTKDKSSQFLKLFSSSSQQLKQDVFDQSDFMDEIRKQIELKAALKKSPITENQQLHRPSSLFHQLTKKRSNTKN